MVHCVTFQNTAKKYETTTGRSHRFIPEIPQNFDCRVKALVKKESLNKDIQIKENQFLTTHQNDYIRKSIEKKLYTRGVRANVDYTRIVEEKFFQKPFPPIKSNLSTMKNSYRMNFKLESDDRAIKPPSITNKCYVSKLGFEQQPAIPVDGRGYWKLTDPYLTTYKIDYVSDPASVHPAIKSRILTYNNAPTFELPSVSGNKSVFDRKVFKNVLPLRFLYKPIERVPNFGMTSEKQDNYKKQTSSILYPYINSSCTRWNDPLPDASSFETEIAPGMYCTEYCHYGRNPVRQIVDLDPSRRKIRHNIKECSPICAK